MVFFKRSSSFVSCQGRWLEDKDHVSWRYLFATNVYERLLKKNLCEFGSQQSCQELDEMLWYEPNNTRGIRFGLPCSSNISRQEHLIEIRITPQARSIMSSLNDSCWSNISTQEHLFEIRITSQARLIMSSLNDSTCNLNYIELQRNLAIG